MNHTYRLVWNEATQSYVPAAEGTRARKKSGGCKALKRLGVVVAAAALGSSYIGVAHAGPSGGEVVAGQASIEHSGVTTTINQQSQNVSLNWQQFNVAANEMVQFVQPSATAIALNRVIGSEASQIYGRLSANGQVFLINPNGVLFGRGAQVDVGGLVASTLNISDEDFLAGRYRFTSSSATPGSVVNQGTITAASGGSVALLGGQVSNQGTISAQLGTVALAAGSAVSLDFSGQQLMNVQVDAATLGALADNQQLIQANGGTVIMTAAARDALLSTVVNNTGVIEARSAQNHDGVIKLLGSFEGGTVHVGGTLDASALPSLPLPLAGEGAVNGGFIDTSGAHVTVADGARVSTLGSGGGTAGTWLVDPTDFTIAAGNAAQTTSGIGADTLAGNLATTSVEIQTVADGSEAGDIHVNADVSWTAATTLTLTAHHDVNVNAEITNNTPGGGVTLRADSQGACVAGAAASACGTVNFSVPGRITAETVNLYYNPAGSNAAADGNGIGPIYTPTDYATNVTVTGTLNAYMLVNDVNQLQAMNTRLDGRYALGRDIDASATSGWNGGEGFVPIGNFTTNFTGHFDGLGHTISDLFIDRPGTDYVGLFGVATDFGSTIRNVGLLGGSISGNSSVGALVGLNGGTVSNAYASGAVSGNDNVGGLVGFNGGTVSNAYASGAVSGDDAVGGLVGYNFTGGTVSNAYATGAVSGDNWVGGLVGINDGGTVSNAYATAAVSGLVYVGGLVGVNLGTVSRTYATGPVSGVDASTTGGLVGASVGTVSESFWDVDTTLQTISAGGTGKTSAEMRDADTFSAWYISAVGGSTATWRIYDGYTGPLLRSFLTRADVAISDVSSTYNGTDQGLNFSYDAGSADTSLIFRGTVNARNVGSYSLGEHLYSGQQGYDIVYTGGALDIARANLVLSTSNVVKTYDGTTDASGTLIIAGGTTLFGTDSLSGGTFAFADRNAGTGNRTVTTSGVTIDDGNGGGNYNVTYADNTTSTIDRANLTLAATSSTRTYDGTTASSGAVVASGIAVGDSVDATQAYASRNVMGIDGSTLQVAGYSITDGSGADMSGNYNVTTATAAGTINAATLTVGGVSAADKIYDATVDAAVSGVLSGVIGSDAVDLLQSGAFADKNAGADKVVTARYSLSGSDAGNYVLASESATTTASITPASLTITANDQIKVTGTPNPALTLTYRGFVAGESVASLTTPAAASTTADISSPAGSYVITASGAASSNYVFTYVLGTLTVSNTHLPGYLETLSYLDDLGSEESLEKEDRLKDPPFLLEIRDKGIRLPAGVQ